MSATPGAADHYARLGVSRHASVEEIRAAFRRRARELHPDTHRGRSTGERARLAEELSLVSEAWRVLRDPAARRRYDDQLRVFEQRAEPPPVYESYTTRAGPDDADEVEVYPSGASPVLRSAPWLVLAAVLVAIFVFTAFATAARDDDGPGGVDGFTAPGDCVVVSSGRPVAEVPCAERHDGVVVAVVPFAQPCPSGLEYFVTADGTRRACVDTGPRVLG